MSSADDKTSRFAEARAELPVGPELDRAVALAMGWTEIKVYSLAGYAKGCPPDRGSGFVRQVPQFSTEHRRIDELLAWLYCQGEPHCEEVIVVAHPNKVVASVILDDAEDCPSQVSRRGKTIPEALSRLVLAVSEAGDE